MSEEISKTGEVTEETVPVGPIGLVAMKGTEALAHTIDEFLVSWRSERSREQENHLLFKGYTKDSYLIDYEVPRFGSGEGKGVINSESRGDDMYFLVDVTNHSLSYSIGGMRNHYSPDDHYQDLKRVIAAAAGTAKRMTLIMPFLYEGRMDNREEGEGGSLDCAQMLKELVAYGITDVITFDANDPRVQNAIPLGSFDTISPSYQYIKALCKRYDDIIMDPDHLMVISPDVNGMKRAIYLASVLGVDMGMFYERKDYSRIVNGENPIAAHEYLGADVADKDIIIVDDMISSGDSILDVAGHLKQRGAKRVFCCVTYGLFTNGLAIFDEAADRGVIDKVFTTNLIYQSPDLLSKKWYASVDMGKFVALLIDHLNHDASISSLLDPADRINKLLANYKEMQTKKGII